MSDEYDSDLYSEYSTTESFEYMYDAEEASTTKFNIVLCEIYNEIIHGKPTSELLNTHYIVMHRFKEFKKYEIEEIINDYIFDLERWGLQTFGPLSYSLSYSLSQSLSHPIIRNYNCIYNKIKPEIAECIYLNTNEYICILKTFWIRLIQRTWKNIFKRRKEVLKSRCHIKSLLYREYKGKWPINCIYNPTIVGMLSYLSRK